MYLPASIMRGEQNVCAVALWWHGTQDGVLWYNWAVNAKRPPACHSPKFTQTGYRNGLRTPVGPLRLMQVYHLP